MTNPEGEFKTEAAKALDDIQSIINRIEADGGAAVGYVRLHMVWVIGICCLLFGFIAGLHVSPEL